MLMEKHFNSVIHFDFAALKMSPFCLGLYPRMIPPPPDIVRPDETEVRSKTPANRWKKPKSIPMSYQ